MFAEIIYFENRYMYAHESSNNLIFFSEGWQLVVLAFLLERSRSNILRFCLCKERQSVLSSCAFDFSF